MLTLIVLALASAVIPFATVRLIGSVTLVIAVGAGLAAIEWVWAYSDSSDPASGSEWTGFALVAWTGFFALLGFSLWVAGAMVGAVARRRRTRAHD